MQSPPEQDPKPQRFEEGLTNPPDSKGQMLCICKYEFIKPSSTETTNSKTQQQQQILPEVIAWGSTGIRTSLFVLEKHVSCYHAPRGSLSISSRPRGPNFSSSSGGFTAFSPAQFWKRSHICTVAVQTFLLAFMPTGHLTKHCTSLI